MSNPYQFTPGGSLKLKGTVAEGGVVKRRKKKSKSAKSKPDTPAVKDSDGSATAAASSSAGTGTGASSDRKTDAEKRFDETQRKRLARKVAQLAGKSHKDRVSEFNTHLESLSEHHDIPKVGPG